jgi:hypothetical protein
VSKYHEAPQGVIQMDEMYEGKLVNPLMLVLLYLFLYSIIFFFKSSQVLQLIPLLKADLEAREYLVPFNVVLFLRRGPRIYIKH